MLRIMPLNSAIYVNEYAEKHCDIIFCENLFKISLFVFKERSKEVNESLTKFAARTRAIAVRAGRIRRRHVSGGDRAAADPELEPSVAHPRNHAAQARQI